MGTQNTSILEKYNISPNLSKDEKLALLEKAKQKLLRKLNHVFGDPEKEKELNEEMDLLEQAMDQLRADGGMLSFSDVILETRELSQISIVPGQKKELEIKEKERRLLEDDLTYMEKYTYVHDVAIFYMRNHDWEKYGYWSQHGAMLGIGHFMSIMYDYYTLEMFGKKDSQKALYWLKKAAEAGEKDCCMELGKYYLQKNSPQFSLQNAVLYFVKAADEEHPDAYLMAFSVFQTMGLYEKAEICLKAAYDMGLSGAAYRMALIYDTKDNKTGERQADVAKYWYERAYSEKPDGDICYGLGRLYLESGQQDLGIQLLIQGHKEFGSEDCLEELKGLV